MQYKINIESNFKNLHRDLKAAEKTVNSIISKLKQKHKVNVNIQQNIKTKLNKPLIDAEKIIKKINSSKISVPVKVTGTTAVNALNKSIKLVGQSVQKTIGYLKNMSTQLRITENGMNFLVRGNGIVGNTVAYVATESASEFINLEHAINRVRSVAGETKVEYELLKEATLKVAESSSLTAEEITRGSEILALAGFKTKEIIDIQERLVTSVINSGESMAVNADNVTSSIRVWNTDLKVLDDTIDKLTAGMANSKTTVGELGRGAAAAGNVFKQTGQSTSALVSTLQAMADQSIKGATAGKGLSTLLQRMASPTARATKLMNEYGISLTEAGTNANQQIAILGDLDTMVQGTNTIINELSQAYSRGERSIAPYLTQLEALGIQTRTATGNYKSFDHVVEQLIRRNTKAYELQAKVNNQFGNSNRITNKLASELNKLGVNTGLTGGSMKSIITIAEELAVKFKSISEAERLAFASDLAGKHQAPKLLALVGAAEKANHEITILGEKFTIYTSKLSLNSSKNDLATVSGRKLATVFKDMGIGINELLPAVSKFSLDLDRNSKSIVGSNGSIDEYIRTIIRFKGPHDEWIDAIGKATEASKIMSDKTTNLNVVLKRLGSNTEFTDMNSALDELKRHIDRSSDTQVLHAFNDVMSQDMAASFVIASQNGVKFSTELQNQLGLVVGKSREMRTEIEDTTKHILDRLISTWGSTKVAIGEAMQPLLDKFLQVGIIGSQVLGDLLPPLVSGMVKWLDKFDWSTENVRRRMIEFFEVVEKVGKTIYDVFVTILEASGASSITFDGIIKGITDSLRIVLTVIEGVGNGLSWLGLISDAKASAMEDSFNRLDKTFDSVTGNINNNTDGVVRKLGYWVQETAGSTNGIRHELDTTRTEFDITKNNIFSFTDDVSRDMHKMHQDVSTEFTSLHTHVVDTTNNMATSVQSSIETMRHEATTSVTNLANDVPTQVESMSERSDRLAKEFSDALQKHAENTRLGVTNSVANMVTEVDTTVASMVTTVPNHVESMKNDVTSLSEIMKNDTVSQIETLATSVPTLVEDMKTKASTTVDELRTSIVDNSTLMNQDATSQAEELKNQVSIKVGEMKTNTIEKTSGLVSDMSSMFTTMKDYVVDEASSMYDGVVSAAGKAVNVAKQAASYVSSIISSSSSGGYKTNEYVAPEYKNSTTSIEEYMSGTSSITASMQNTTINTGSTGFLRSVNSGSYFVPPVVTNGTASAPQITKTRNADGSITYSNKNNYDTAKEQLEEIRKTNEILTSTLNANNFYIAVT